MDNKRFDHIEQQMKTASEGWEPPFSEAAWERMEQMLEGENDRKRPVAWWIWLLPLFLLLGTGAYFMLNNEGGVKKETAVIKNTPADKNTTVVEQDKAGSPETVIAATENTIPPAATTQTGSGIAVYKKPGSVKIKIGSPSAVAETRDDVNAAAKKTSGNEKGKVKMAVAAAAATEDKEDQASQQPGEKYADTNEPVALNDPATGKKPATTPAVPANKETKNEKPGPEENSKTKTETKKNKPSSKFYFAIAAGMEGNGVDFPGTSKFSTRAGVLAGYQLTPKLSVQAGFFAGNKKYVAGKNDYKAKEGSYWSMVDITRVDANCRVFEIPLALRYDFAPSRKWNVFAGAGLSSYIMDKEDYDYDYTRYNMPYQGKASYTGNQHFFSVLKLSGGMERKLSPQFSLGINPGLAIPLAGVGDGQIKLFSSELLLSLKYRPFRKSK